MANRYSQLQRLIRKWPVNEQKIGRELGGHLKSQVAIAFKHGENTKVDEAKCDRDIRAISNIVSDTYLRKYPFTPTRTVLGNTLEELKEINSNEFAEALKEEGRTYTERLRSRLQTSFPKLFNWSQTKKNQSI